MNEETLRLIKLAYSQGYHRGHHDTVEGQFCPPEDNNYDTLMESIRTGEFSGATLNRCRFLAVDAGVRYWEDARINGIEDTAGLLMPFIELPGRWCPVIDLESGAIVGWPKGMEARVHYKVCDDGVYYLNPESTGRAAFRWKGDYVPDRFLCHGDSGYGDYIKMTVDGDGRIKDYVKPTIDPDEWEAMV